SYIFLRNKATILAGIVLFFAACSKQLDVSPKIAIDANGALSSRDAIEASITTIYANLKPFNNYGRDLIALPEALSDNGFATNKSGRLLPEAQ
ncbi:hypothetical protein ABTE99_18985, partial [Acinetobacter baumannii]